MFQRITSRDSASRVLVEHFRKQVPAVLIKSHEVLVAEVDVTLIVFLDDFLDLFPLEDWLLKETK